MKELKTKRRKKQICFISLNIYPLLTGISMGYVAGGAEKRLALLARELIKHDYEITFITYGNNAGVIEYISGMKVIKIYRREDIPHLNPIRKAIYIWKALKMADNDICLESPGSSGIISLFCNLQHRINVLSIASDGYVQKRPTVKMNFYYDFLRKLNIKMAHTIIVQSDLQKHLVKQNFLRDSIVIKNPCLLSNEGVPHKQSPPLILWVAELRNIKQADVFLELAKAIPEAQFEMIGGIALGEEGYFHSIKQAANLIPNLNFVGFVPQEKIETYFAKASILVNTSIVEGFPNTFLEAWTAYLPVVSLNADPDEIICRFRLGFHSFEFRKMVEDIRKLLNNKKLREEMGLNGRRYVEREHNMDNIVNQYAKLFQKLTGD